jgi:hypothetical protein
VARRRLGYTRALTDDPVECPEIREVTIVPSLMALVLAVAIGVGGCVTLTLPQQDVVADVQRFADATAAVYNLPRIRLTIEPATNLGIGGRYRLGNFYLNVRMLNTGHLNALVAHELAHYVLGHDTPVAGSSMAEFQRGQEVRELDANAKAVEILMRGLGLSQRQAVETMVVFLKAAQTHVDRGNALAWGHRPPAEEIADLVGRFPGYDVAAAERPILVKAALSDTGRVEPPRWTAGDEWTYWWKEPQGSGTFRWVFDREEAVDGVDHYVLKSGTQRDIFYRKSDLAGHLEKVSGQVQTRYVPPEIRLTWPVVVGREWEQTVTRERSTEPRVETSTRRCRIESEESLTVTAGTFRVFKTVCREPQSGKVLYQVWYSPDAKTWVRDWRPLADGVMERELIRHKTR